MKRLILAGGLFVIAFIPVDKALGFVQSAAPGTGTVLRWFVFPIQYRINSRGTLDVPGIAERAAVDAAFATWDAIANSGLAFSGDTTTAGFNTADGINTILWLDDVSDDPAVASRPDVMALTRRRGDAVTGQISEVDIALNGVSYSWSVLGDDNFASPGGPVDVQAIVTHEIGHLVGLDHVTSPTATMYVSAYPGDISLRSLSQDELSAAVFIYPSAGAPPESSISGQVTRGGFGVPRAYVAAFQGGRAIVGSLADAAGNYRIHRLPPGVYTVRAQPYSNSGTVTQSTFYQSPTNVDVDFLSIFYPNTASEVSATPVTVTSGTETPNINMLVSSSGSVDDPFEPDDTGTAAKAIALDGSAQIHHSWDPNPLAADEDWVTFNVTAGRVYVIETRNLGLRRDDSSGVMDSATFLELHDGSVTTPPYPFPLASNISRNSFEQDRGSRIVLFAAANGVRKVRVLQRQFTTKGAATHFDLSVRELVAPFPSPTLTSVVQMQGTEDGGIVVSINGSNFIPGAAVSFGGVAGTQVDVQNCQTPTDCRVIKVLVPAHSPGMVTVQVTNPAGGGGSLTNGFEYLSRRVGVFADGTFDAFGGFIGDGVGLCWGDYDNDGNQDVFRPTSGAFFSTFRLLHNSGGGVFTDATASAGLDTLGFNQASCAWGDYDNDGDLDLYVVYSTALNVLYRNNGNGTFTNVAGTAGVGGATSSPSDSDAAWADFDQDGDLDLLLVYESSGGTVRSHQLFRNNGNSTFTDVAASAGLAIQKFTRACKWADYDNDGFADLYLVNLQGQSDQLFHNNRNGTFADVTSVAGIVEGVHCWNALWADLNDDGLQDLFCSSVETTPGQNFRLWVNAGNGAFFDWSATSGVQTTSCSGFGGAITALDKDNDGDVDLYVGCDNNDRLLENLGADPPVFTNVAIASGVNETTFLRSAYGVGAADIDNDYDLDVLVTGLEEDADYLWRNISNTNQGLTVRLIGTVENKLGIGARVTVIPDLGGNPDETSCLAADGIGGARHLQAIGGSGDQNSMELEFGLGSQPVEAREVDCVNVIWPRSGLKRGFPHVAVNQLLSITESSPSLLVTKVAPASGLSAGGTDVTVFGFNFSSAVPSYPQVFFGGIPATNVVFQSANTIRCTTPAHASGAVDVRVENSSFSSNTLPGGFTYVGLEEDITLTVTRNGANVVLTWTDVEQRAYYRVKRALGPTPADFSTAVCVVQAGKTFTDVGAAGNTTNYFYRVDTTLSCP